jgi:hypothetical protein
MNPADAIAKLARLRELLQDESRLPRHFVVLDEHKARFRALPSTPGSP